MTELEKYQQEKRSGLYETTIEPIKDDPYPDITTLPPIVSAPVPQASATTPEPPQERVAFQLAWDEVRKSRREHESLKKLVNIALWVFLLALIALAMAAYQLWADTPKEKAAIVLPQKTKIVYRTKTNVKFKVKKVYISKTDIKWRRKMCDTYGDWNACLAYKKNLPLRARVGRLDIDDNTNNTRRVRYGRAIKPNLQHRYQFYRQQNVPLRGRNSRISKRQRKRNASRRPYQAKVVPYRYSNFRKYGSATSAYGLRRN